MAQRNFGSLGFLVVSVLGGMISSASTTATAASLAAAGQITPATAGIGAVLTSMSSALINLPLVYQQACNASLTRLLAVTSLITVAVGVAALIGVEIWGCTIDISRFSIVRLHCVRLARPLLV